MTEVEKLRALLADANEALLCCRGLTNLGDRIDAALAEPVTECAGCAAALTARDEARALRGVDAEKARREVMLLKMRVSDLKFALGTDAMGWFDRFKHAERERDEARAEVERLRALLPPDAERSPKFVGRGSWSVFAEKVVAERDEARAEVERLKPLLDAVRAARSMLCQLQDHVSDQACDELLSILSDEPLDADGNLYRSPSEAAYQQGAEAMREAAAGLAYAQLAHTLTDVHEKIRALPLPEDKL